MDRDVNKADVQIKNSGKKQQSAAKRLFNGNSKLFEADVKSNKNSYKAKELNQYPLAKQYRGAQYSIGAMVRKDTWRHV